MELKKSTEGKLNPFALPTETDVRFLLLIISALGLALALNILLRYTLNPDAVNPFSGVPQAPGDLPLDEFFQAQVEYAIGLMLVAISTLILPLFLIGLTFLLAAVFYYDHPRRIRRQKRAVPLALQSDPRFEQELTALSAQAGLQSLPRIELGKKLSSQDGQAFGVGRQKSLYLDAGLRVLLRKSVENFRAIVRHELAHIVNRDIGRTYFAQSLWSAVIIVTILPLFVSILYLLLTSTYSKIANGFTSADLQDLLFVKLRLIAGLLLQSGGLITLVLLTRAGLLRTREVYADWRAALWGSASTLASIFEAQSHRSKTGFSPFRLHPSPTERLNTLHKPHLLFDIHFDVPFVVGVFTALVLNGLIEILFSIMLTIGPGLIAVDSALVAYARNNLPSDSFFLLLPVMTGLITLSTGIVLLLPLSPFLILAPLAAATVGLQVQRQALADLAEQRSGVGPYLRLALPAAWMGLGIAVGMLLTPFPFLAPDSLINALLALFFLIVFVFFIWLVLVYTRFFSSRLLGSHAKFTLPLGKNRFLTALVAALFLAIEAPLVVGFFIITKISAFNTLQAFLILMGIAMGMLVLIGLTFIFQWVVFRAYRWLRPVRCPACGQVSSESTVVGKSCQRCGENMVPWLYVTV
jgi:Zn-dependent protease with chaperone function